MSGARWWRVWPGRARQSHAADRWRLGGDDNVTLCGRPFGSLADRVIEGGAVRLVDCERCRAVLDNRAARLAAGAGS